jgi:hypothetical protein
MKIADSNGYISNPNAFANNVGIALVGKVLNAVTL